MARSYRIEGPAVVVPARVAALLERHLRLDRVRVEVRGADAELDAVLSDWAVVAKQHRQVSHQVSSIAPHTKPAAQSTADDDPWLSARQVADLVGVTAVAVRKARRQGRLTGRHIDGAWKFHRDEVERWRSERTAA